jgi:hypothetical protein
MVPSLLRNWLGMREQHRCTSRCTLPQSLLCRARQQPLQQQKGHRRWRQPRRQLQARTPAAQSQTRRRRVTLLRALPSRSLLRWHALGSQRDWAVFASSAALLPPHVPGSQSPRSCAHAHRCTRTEERHEAYGVQRSLCTAHHTTPHMHTTHARDTHTHTHTHTHAHAHTHTHTHPLLCGLS